MTTKQATIFPQGRKLVKHLSIPTHPDVARTCATFDPLCAEASGWRQQVDPKVFGNVTEQDVLQIWNSPAYCSFRGQVTSYDYPGCSNCSLAPCDYVQTEEFEQDCHIGDVPCGACLWCTGVFQCLQ